MSAVDLLLPEPVADVPFSVRLAERYAKRVSQTSAALSDRRAYTRRSARELDWLRLIRLTGGKEFDVTLVDLSEGGALIEVDSPLRPGVQLKMELIGTGLEALVPLEVLRSYVANLAGGLTVYRGACRFVHPIELPRPDRRTASSPHTAPVTVASADFVGTDAVLSYLLERCGSRPGRPSATPAARVTLEREAVLHVLESLHSREASAADAASRHTMDLLGTILPAIRRGDSRQDVVAALHRQLGRLPVTTRSLLRVTSSRLAALVHHCTPSERRAHTAIIVPNEAARQLEAPAPATLTTSVPQPQTDSALQKIVVRYADGQLLKGFTQDFHPSRPQFSLWRTIKAAPSERVVVPISSLKAVFFVKDFNGNPGYRERKTFTVRGQGRRIEVTFLDTEVILGTTLNYRPDAQGFFVIPVDPAANNSRVFVVATAVRRVRFV
jgi:PilZ domain